MKIAQFVFAYLAVGVLVVAAVTGIGYWQAWWLRNPGLELANAQTDVMRQSNQYVTSQLTRLNTLLAEYQRLDPAAPQRAAIINEMWNIRGTIPDERLSPELSTFFFTHQRGSR